MNRDPGTPQLWHVLTESSVPVAEFSLALSRLTDVVAWVPKVSGFGCLQNWTKIEPSEESTRLRRVHFPLQRGLSRFSFQAMAAAYRKVYALLMQQTECEARTALLCTSSFFAPVAQRWKGPVIYYATDYTFAYEGLSSERVLAADRAMCAVADLVCPNSDRLSKYLTERCGCSPERITVTPNATRAANVRCSPTAHSDPLPLDVPPMARPVAGIIGSMAANLDWKMLAEVIERVPEYSWLFVGPSSMTIREPDVRKAREEVMRHPRASFVGAKPYKDLVRYARAIDVAVMPYKKREPTYSGSATRFYEHLAAGRPIVATRAVAELLDKEPLLHLVENGEEMAQHLLLLRGQGSDGYEEQRFLASKTETWERRAQTLVDALAQSRIAHSSHAFRSDLASNQHYTVAGIR